MLATLRHRSTLLLLSLLTLAGAFVRLYGLGEWDYSLDEIWHVYVAKQPTLADVFYTNLVEDGHPILGYFLWHWLLNIWDDPWMMRLPAIIAGTLCIPAGYLLGKEIFSSKNGGLFAAFFMAFSCLMIEQSNLVRGYTLMLLFSMMAIWSVYRYRKTFQMWFILSYFVTMSLALLLEFAVAPVVVFTALHLGVSILRKPVEKLPLVVLWLVVHSVWALYLIWFVMLLKTLGGLDFSQSDIFIYSEGKSIVSAVASVIIYFLEYANLAGFFWFLGGALQSEVFVLLPLLAFLMLTFVGCVALWRQRTWDLLLLNFIVITVTIVFYLHNIIPLGVRHNMSVILVFMILSYYGIRHCAMAIAIKSSGFRRISVSLGMLIVSASLSLGYFLQGENWRHISVIEFQKTRARIDEMRHTLKDNVADNDLVISDLYSIYHIWGLDRESVFRHTTNNVGIVQHYKPKLVIRSVDLRLKSFVLSPYKMQTMFRELDSLGMLRGVENVWLLSSHVRSTVVDPAYSSKLKQLIPDYIAAKHVDELGAIINEQKNLGDELYEVASFKKLVFMTSCDGEKLEHIKMPHSCVLNMATLKFPVKVIYDKFINAPDYQDIEFFVDNVRSEVRQD